VESLKNRKEILGWSLLLLAVLGMVYWPIVVPMVKQWARDENYSHGFLVPLISLYMAYLSRDKLLEAEVRPSNSGLVLIGLGLVMLLLGWLGTEYFTMRSSMVVIIAGAVLFTMGREIFKILSIPLAYLLLMVPIPYIVYDAAAFPLKLFVTKVSVLVMKALGVVVLQEGNILIAVHTENHDEMDRAQEIFETAEAVDICTTSEKPIPQPS